MGQLQRRVGSLVIAVCLLTSACVESVVLRPSSLTVPDPTSSLTAPPGGATPTPVASPSASAGPSLEGTLTCAGMDLAFPADVLSLPPGAEAGLDAAARALRDLVGSETGSQLGLPRSGWRLVTADDTNAVYLAVGGGASAFVTLVNGTAGWEMNEGGRCDLAVQPPDGAGYASWRIDPASPPTAASTQVTVLATEVACAGGNAPLGRLLPPIILATEEAVTIAVFFRTAPGSNDCPGNPEVPVIVDFGGALGSRRLFDGSSVPPIQRF
jgi:hypothetical protein